MHPRVLGACKPDVLPEARKSSPSLDSYFMILKKKSTVKKNLDNFSIFTENFVSFSCIIISNPL